MSTKVTVIIDDKEFEIDESILNNNSNFLISLIIKNKGNFKEDLTFKESNKEIFENFILPFINDDIININIDGPINDQLIYISKISSEFNFFGLPFFIGSNYFGPTFNSFKNITVNNYKFLQNINKYILKLNTISYYIENVLLQLKQNKKYIIVNYDFKDEILNFVKENLNISYDIFKITYQLRVDGHVYVYKTENYKDPLRYIGKKENFNISVNDAKIFYKWCSALLQDKMIHDCMSNSNSYESHELDDYQSINDIVNHTKIDIKEIYDLIKKYKLDKEIEISLCFLPDIEELPEKSDLKIKCSSGRYNHDSNIHVTYILYLN